MAAPIAASAAQTSSLTTTVAGPPSTPVGAVSHFDVQVVNSGSSATTAPWTISVQLPKSNGTYGQLQVQVVLGTVGVVSPGCVVGADLNLLCTMTSALSNVPGANTQVIGFDITLPYIKKQFSFPAIATAANDDGLGGNSASATTAQTFTTVTAPIGQATVDYCGGVGLDGTGRRSFYECVVTPGLTMTYKMTMAPGGTLTNFLFNNKPVPTRGGTWAINGTRLDVVLTNNSTQLATMSLQGVSARCWEGPLSTAYGQPVAAPAQYRICL